MILVTWNVILLGNIKLDGQKQINGCQRLKVGREGDYRGIQGKFRGGDDETVVYLNYIQLHDTVFAPN